MRHGSLFSGIGGFDLAAEWMGWENIFHCEWNEFGQRHLQFYWPQAISYHDITKTDFSIHRGQIDIITGGFPCQPYSLAGKRKGKDDERHLWPEMLRAIREIKPAWVVGENVFGLVNWSDGLVFEEVCADLEAEGYEVQPFILPAAGVNAPHKRDRVWFVGYSEYNGRAAAEARRNDKKSSFTTRQNEIRESAGTGCIQPGSRITQNTVSDGCLCREFEQDGTEDGQQRNTCTGNCNGVCGNEVAGIIANTDSAGIQGQQVDTTASQEYRQRREGFEKIRNTGHIGGWSEFPTQPPVCSRNDGIPTELDGITFSKWRNESIKAAGNAIVPQVVYQIFKAIEEYERLPKLDR